MGRRGRGGGAGSWGSWGGNLRSRRREAAARIRHLQKDVFGTTVHVSIDREGESILKADGVWNDAEEGAKMRRKR